MTHSIFWIERLLEARMNLQAKKRDPATLARLALVERELDHLSMGVGKMRLVGSPLPHRG